VRVESPTEFAPGRRGGLSTGFNNLESRVAVGALSEEDSLIYCTFLPRESRSFIRSGAGAQDWADFHMLNVPDSGSLGSIQRTVISIAVQDLDVCRRSGCHAR